MGQFYDPAECIDHPIRGRYFVREAYFVLDSGEQIHRFFVCYASDGSPASKTSDAGDATFTTLADANAYLRQLRLSDQELNS